MKQNFVFLLILLSFQTFAQNKISDSTFVSDTIAKIQSDTAEKIKPADSNAEVTTPEKQTAFTPYHTGWKDGLAIGGATGVTLLGYHLIKNKKDLTHKQLDEKKKSNLPFFDRGNAGYYSKKIDQDSYILFNSSYAIPVVAALLNKKERAKFGQVMVMYLETVAITGSMYTLTAGLVYRSRPFVYGNIAPLEKRLDKGAQRSFYGGHVATTAAVTFFTAKVFSDFNPDSKLRPYLYVAAGGLTALMGYMRYEAGYHFLSDCVVSGVIGTATGILIPEFHKKKAFKNVSLTPFYQGDSKGFSVVYRF